MKKTLAFLVVICCFLFNQSLPGKEIKILTNHIGYETNGAKHAVVLGHEGDDISSFQIKNLETGEEALSGAPQKIGPVQKWKDWYFWTIDFDEVAEKGVYVVECVSEKETVRSFPFMIQENILEKNTLSDVIYYFKGQRSSGLLDKADKNMTFSGGKEGEVDVQGGWYDATGDYGKHLSHLSFSTYFNPQQVPLAAWSLFKTYEILDKRDDPNFRQYKRRLLDEAMFGADFLVRMKDPRGSFFRTVSGSGSKKAPEDRRITPVMKRFRLAEKPSQNSRYTEDEVISDQDYEVGYRAGAGVAIAVLAMASRYDVSGDFDNEDYLKAAVDAFAFLEEHNLELTNDGKENIVDDYCALVAAVELHRATNNEKYKAAAEKRAKSLMGRLISSGRDKNYWRADSGDRPFFHPVDAGFPVVSLLDYLDIADKETTEKILETVKKAMGFELTVTDEVNNPFGYARQFVQSKNGKRRTSFFFPHDTETAPWWQGENARLASMATAARMASKYFKQDKAFYNQLQAYATNQLNWILGLNPYDACMLQGAGRNNPDYLFFSSYEYTNAPGGIVNGITAGLNDEDDIDFQVPYAVTGKDNDWRWGEQWLPHASWFLLAVASK